MGRVTTAGDRHTSIGRLTGTVLRHRRIVLVAWLVVFAFGGYASSRINKHLSYDFSLPGQQAYTTGSTILHLYGNGGTTVPSVLVVTVGPGQTVAGDASEIDAGLAAAQRAEPALRIVGLDDTASQPLVTRDGMTTWAYVFAPPNESLGLDPRVGAAEQALAKALPGDKVTRTGINELGSGGSTSGPGVLVETIIGGAGALAVLVFVFASFLALLPLLVAAVSILATFLVLLGLSYVTEVSFVVQFLVALVGLGIAIDYSLLVVTRWREERARGLPNEAAIVAAMETAGRAVLLSGLTVAIGLLSLVVIPDPLLRSTGIGGMLIPVISVGVVLTLLPALLGGIGPRWDWPRVRDESHASRGWHAWAKGLTRVPWLGAGAAVVLLLVAAFPMLHIRVGQTSAAAEASTGTAATTYTLLLAGGTSPGVLSPMEVLTGAGQAPAVARTLAGTAGVSAVLDASGRAGNAGGTTDLVVVPDIETVDSSSLGPVRAVEHATSGMPGVLGVTGEGPSQQAFASAVYGNTPYLLLVLAALTFLLLARAFRSVLLAVKAVVVNLVSLVATFGVLTWFWQDGHGSSAVFGIPATGAITFWVPITVFAFLFGLSMDYEVFILTRMREEYEASGSTETAVVNGLARTGRLVTSAALILFFAFASLASAPITDVKVLATGLGIGILLDAVIIRTLLVPSLVTLFGRWNWWIPRPLARMLFIREPAVIREPAA
jgi:RND superfamily putative drug exporter